MRTIALLALAVSPVLSAQREEKHTQAHFVVGQITSVVGQAQVDLGFVHGFKQGHKFALFRKRAAWGPVGIVRLTKVGSYKSTVQVVRGAKPGSGDIVLVHQNTVGYQTGKMRDDYYITRRILNRQYQNGYDTGNIATDTRQLYSQLDNSRRWFRQKRRAGTKINYGTKKAVYESAAILQLAKQCQLVAEIQEDAPGGLRSLSPRWNGVLPLVTGYTPPKLMKPEGDEENSEDFAEEPAPNIFPAVADQFREETVEFREAVSMILGAAVANPPPNSRYYIRTKFRQSQFPKIADQPDVIERLDEFLSTVN